MMKKNKKLGELELEKGLNALDLEYEKDGNQIKIPTNNENLKKLLKGSWVIQAELEEETEELKSIISDYVNIVLHDRKEIDRLNNIIKEVREYIETKSTGNLKVTWGEEILEILDKGE